MNQQERNLLALLRQTKIEALEAELAASRAENVKLEAEIRTRNVNEARLRETLENLTKECSGLLSAHEYALSMDGGNSNMECLRRRVDIARAALQREKE